MKILLPSICALALLAACGKPASEHAGEHERAPENGAQFKEGKGLALSDEMKKALRLEVAEVTEEKVTPTFSVGLHVLESAEGLRQVSFSPTANEASGWLTAAQAALVQPGMKVELHAEGTAGEGTVRRLEKLPYPTLGDFEVTIATDTALPTGSRVTAVFRGSAGEAVAAIPRKALLTTAEGHFVYATNGEFFTRTPIKVGTMNADHVEVSEGLYTGDQIVSSPVMSLWMAELQVLRGGKACTCGH